MLRIPEEEDGWEIGVGRLGSRLRTGLIRNGRGDGVGEAFDRSP